MALYKIIGSYLFGIKGDVASTIIGVRYRDTENFFPSIMQINKDKYPCINSRAKTSNILWKKKQAKWQMEFIFPTIKSP